jgi:hypothetical protein
MPITKYRSTKNSEIIPLLAGELENEIPNLDLYGSEKKLLDFAYKDLETCLIEKVNDTYLIDIKEILKNEANEKELKSFLKVWTKKWIDKWRERVTFCQKMPQFSLNHIKARKKAIKIFKHMKNAQELKKMIVLKLINEGEVCMVELIAENMIIEEITSRLKAKKTNNFLNKTLFDPLSIYQQVAPRIKNLSERKKPIIHLKLLIDI